MKTDPYAPGCILRSVTYTPERRVMIFASNAPHPEPGQRPLISRKSPLRLKLLAAPEALFRFEPVIQVRSRAKS